MSARSITLHKLFLTLALFAFTSTLFAQSPFVGTWKLDTAKTKFTTGEAPKDLTVVIEEQGDNFQVTGTGTNADGSAISAKFTVPVKGGTGQIEGGSYETITSKVVSANVREDRLSKGGKVVLSRRIVLSKDGKTMRVTTKGVDPTGKPIAGTEVFDKQ